MSFSVLIPRVTSAWWLGQSKYLRLPSACRSVVSANPQTTQPPRPAPEAPFFSWRSLLIISRDRSLACSSLHPKEHRFLFPHTVLNVDPQTAHTFSNTSLPWFSGFLLSFIPTPPFTYVYNTLLSICQYLCAPYKPLYLVAQAYCHNRRPE